MSWNGFEFGSVADDYCCDQCGRRAPCVTIIPGERQPGRGFCGECIRLAADRLAQHVWRVESWPLPPEDQR